MKRQGRLSRTGLPSNRSRSPLRSLSPGKLLPVIGCMLAGLTVALAFMLVLPGCAQETNRGFPPGGRTAVQQPVWPGVYEIITRLELEPGQLPAVRTVLEEAEDARSELHNEMTAGTGSRPDPGTMAAMRERTEELNETTEKRLSELLTSEQMNEYREMMRKAEEQRPQMAGRRGGQKGGRPGGGGW